MAATNVQAFSGDLDIAGAITSNLEVGTANLFVDTVSGNVGIGTTNPNSKLEVFGTNSEHNTTIYPLTVTTISSSSTEVEEGIGTGIEFRVERQDTDDIQGECGAIRAYGAAGIPSTSDYWNMAFRVRSNDTINESMTIKYNGNVGIGTDDPQAKLTIGPGSSLLFADNRGNSSARNWAIRVNNTTEGDFQLGNTGTNTGGLPDFYANPSHAKITLKNSGYVGIGTTSPSHNLHVNGNIRGTKVFSQSNSPSIDGNYRNYYYINDAYHGWGKILSRNAGQVNGWAVAEFGRKDGGITPFAYRLRGNGNFQFQFSSNQLRIKKNPSSGMSTQWDVLAI